MDVYDVSHYKPACDFKQNERQSLRKYYTGKYYLWIFKFAQLSGHIQEVHINEEWFYTSANYFLTLRCNKNIIKGCYSHLAIEVMANLWMFKGCPQYAILPSWKTWRVTIKRNGYMFEEQPPCDSTSQMSCFFTGVDFAEPPFKPPVCFFFFCGLDIKCWWTKITTLHLQHP